MRRTFASGLARLGVPIPVIERLLNHVSGTFAGIVGTYNRHDYWDEMVDAVNRWDTAADAASVEEAATAFQASGNMRDAIGGVAVSRTFRYRAPAAGEVLP